MKNTYFLILMSFMTLSTLAQVNEDMINPENHWTFGFGVNIVDNDGFQINQPFKAKEWNFNYPMMITAERKWSALLATSVSLSFNNLDENTLQDGFYPNKDLIYIAFDVNGQVYFDHFIFETTRNDWFDAYAIVGLGMPVIDNTVGGSFNTGLGFNFWFSDNWGVRLQSVGKFAFNHGENNQSNHLQHSLSAIIRL